MTTETIDVSRFNKLPKWAQDEMKELKRQAEEAKRALQKHVDGQTPSQVWVESHVCLTEGPPAFQKQFLQTDQVTFQVGDQEIDVRLQDNRLQVHASWKRLVILPEVSNSVWLEVRK